MKNLIFFLLFSPLIGLSQPEFSFDLYFEDALGNRDTITLGYDPLATDGIDTFFGEENIISQPWDSILDVRIGDKSYSLNNWSTENTYLSKKQIISSYCENSIISGRISIQFYAKNNPIKINWNSTFFEDSCKSRTIFYGHQSLIEFDVAGVVSPVLYGDSLFIKSYSYDISIQPEEFWVYHTITNPEYQIKKYSTLEKNIGVLQFLFQKDNPLSLKPISIIDFNVYPNPVRAGGEITVPVGNNYKLTDLSGKILQQGLIEENKINIHNVVNGTYFLHVSNGNNNYITKVTIL